MGNAQQYRVTLLEETHARDILQWKYRAPYDFYNPPQDDRTEEYVKLFLKPELAFHAVLDGESNFVGFCSYGIDGQVRGGDYSEEALDIGVGMKPELTGQGRGVIFMQAIVNHAIAHLGPRKLRLTVANFNRRAFRLYEQMGFVQTDEFSDDDFSVPYTILMREAVIA